MTIQTMIRVIPGQSYDITYTNHRGELELRRVTVKEFWFGVSPYHKDPQMLMLAFCHSRLADRTFATKDIENMGVSP